MRPRWPLGGILLLRLAATRFPLLATLLPLLACGQHALAATQVLHVVAAENFYGDIAAQLAGPHAQVTSVLQNATADPHLFEPGIATARTVAHADLVIYNGLAYDTWMERLLAGGRAPHRRVIVAASVVAARGQTPAPRNPHIWYDPVIMKAVARALSGQLQDLDPSDRPQYAERLRRFLDSLKPLDTEITRLRSRYHGTLVAATEPVAQYLADAVGLEMSNARFQLAVMNDTEPSARDTADLERSLEKRRVRVLMYNSQVVSGPVERLLAIARQARVPVVGFTETEPPRTDYQRWMLDELQALDRALSQTPPTAH